MITDPRDNSFKVIDLDRRDPHSNTIIFCMT